MQVDTGQVHHHWLGEEQGRQVMETTNTHTCTMISDYGSKLNSVACTVMINIRSIIAAV